MFPHAAITAAVVAARRAKEEEQMTTYAGNDLEGWEFKIVRSNFGSFSKTETIQRVCREEAESGWELVEKFDQYRLRFKRRIEHRSKDNSARLDPYRTSPGSGVMGQKLAMIFGLILVAAGVIAYILLQSGRGSGRVALHLPVILVVILAIPIVFLALKKLGR